jgi:ribonucleotide reductase alpha subunit
VLGSPIITNAGRKNRPISACVVIPVDLKADLKTIKKKIYPYYEAAMGNGFDFTELDDPV